MPLAPSAAVRISRSNFYLPEITVEYVLGVLTIFLRWAVRLRTVGLGGFCGDDWLAVLALLLYTTDFTMCWMDYFTGGNIDIRSGQVDSLSDEDVRILTLGSKMEWVTWYSYPTFIWVLKFSILFFYKRISQGLVKPRTISVLFWFCGLTYVALMVTISSTCRPYSANWQIRPLPGAECTFRAQNFMALAVLNVITDMAILTIPMPLLWDVLRVSLLRKLLVGLLLCSGLFVITAAIVRVAITLTSAPSVLTVNTWGNRETLAAVLAISAPVLSPIFRRAFWRGTWHPDGRHDGRRWSSSVARATSPKIGAAGLWLRTLSPREASQPGAQSLDGRAEACDGGNRDLERSAAGGFVELCRDANASIADETTDLVQHESCEASAASMSLDAVVEHRVIRDAIYPAGES